MLRPCPECHRHHAVGERRCPHCDATLGGLIESRVVVASLGLLLGLGSAGCAGKDGDTETSEATSSSSSSTSTSTSTSTTTSTSTMTDSSTTNGSTSISTSTTHDSGGSFYAGPETTSTGAADNFPDELGGEKPQERAQPDDKPTIG